MARWRMGLCSSRHVMPVNRFIYNDPIFKTGKNIDLINIQSIADQALIGCHDGLDLYVTGCGPALGAVISTCYGYKIPLTLYHWDKVGGNYLPQVIFPENSIGLMEDTMGADQLN